jgi:hypothetical protein
MDTFARQPEQPDLKRGERNCRYKDDHDGQQHQ